MNRPTHEIYADLCNARLLVGWHSQKIAGATQAVADFEVELLHRLVDGRSVRIDGVTISRVGCELRETR